MEYAGVTRSKLIAKNTVMLYVRMFFMMLVGLYTSRIVLEALGEDDFGIYNVVGGVVAMFTVISGALTTAISRFITFEMGKSEKADLAKVFSTAVTIQIILSLIVLIVAEPVGLWFLNKKMNIPPDRMTAANWVFQLSIVTFIFNLLSVPFNASIIANERMSAFAFIGIFEGMAKLGVAFLLMRSPIDRLVYYAALMCLVAVAVRMAYTIYCRSHFSECRFRFIWDRSLMNQMFSFAGWNFIGVSAGVLRDHGGNILINIFSGPVANAANAIAVQVYGVASNFVNGFMTAMNPQITKSYASGDQSYMFSLVRNGARYSYYILLFICIPLILKTEFILGVWLKEVPDLTVGFVRLSVILLMSEAISKPMMTAVQATGDIKIYQIVVGGLYLLNLPVSYVFLKSGLSPEFVYVGSIMISQICFFARLLVLQKQMGLRVGDFVNKVYLNVLYVTLLSLLIPYFTADCFNDTALGFLGFLAVSVVSTASVEIFLGMSSDERRKLSSFLIRNNRDGRD